LFAETGPADLLITGVTPWAVKWAVGKVADGIVNGAVDALFWHCKPTPNMLIDPSGDVLDANGNPVSGATVRILRSDTASGPFSAVDPTQPGIEPAINPETTGADGSFHWDVRPGFYDLEASAPGCSKPGSGDPVTTLGPLPVPPPQVGLVLTLACANQRPAPVPALTRLTETSGTPAGGTQLMVLGSGFTPASTVTFGARPAAGLKFLSTTALAVTSPAGAGRVDVRVLNGGNASKVTAADRFAYGTAPAVARLSSTRGTPAGGTRLAITGRGFVGATAVSFGGVPGTHLKVLSDTKLTVDTPAHSPGGVDVQVIGAAGASPLARADRYTFLPSLTVTRARLTVKRGNATLALALRAAAGTPAMTQVAVQLPAGLTLARLKLLRRAVEVRAGRHVRVRISEQGGQRLLVASLRPAARSFELTVKGAALGTGGKLRARSRHRQLRLGFTVRLALSNRERSNLLLGAR
jgi:hypothetical protein